MRNQTPFRRTVALVALATVVLASHGGATAGQRRAPTTTPSSAKGAPTLSRASRTPLAAGWRIQSSAMLRDGGAAISRRGYATAGWIAATVPATVLAARVAAGEYKDPYFGTNLRSIPGTDYEVGHNFALEPMSKDSPYAVSWWYRTEFAASPAPGRRVWLHFGGINYRANVWVNGRKVADEKDVAGAYRVYDFDVTDALDPAGSNALAVETFAPTEKDLGVNWVDWNPMPPDKEMGLWGEVSLATTGPVAVRYPAVATHFADDTLARADLTVVAELENASADRVRGVLEGTVGSIPVSQPVELAARESRTVDFTPDHFPQLRVASPRVWWPAPLGPQNLDRVALRFRVGAAVSDEASARFGIREVTSELTPEGSRMFRVNRRPVLIRGGGWAPDLMLRPKSPERLRAEFDYVRDMNLNTLRLEGKMESDEFLDLADERGVLVMAGWCCCDHWELWDQWKPGDLEVATASVRAQALRLRGHASSLVWLNGSDNPPPPEVEKSYLGALAAARWPNPTLPSATATPSAAVAASGVKMTGPYDFVPPSYWYRDTKNGGAFAFNTETSPGVAIPTVGSLRRMVPADQVWPAGPALEFHAGGGEFATTERFDDAMATTYGPPSGFEDYVNKAQAMAYDGERAMFESYAARKYASTGVVQWMLNNAWPSTIWHLYDYYLQPGGGYFGAKKACEPLHVQYSYDDRGVVVVNGLYQAAGGLRVEARLFDETMRETFAKSAPLDAPADSARTIFAVPAAPIAAARVSFLRLSLKDAKGREVSSNVYWLPANQTEFDWEKTTFYWTPATSREDMTALSSLPRVKLGASARIVGAATGGPHAGSAASPYGTEVEVRLSNPGKTLAFQAHASVVDAATGEEVAPILWDDNYVTLMPGESKTLRARFGARGAVKVRIDGLNLETVTVGP